MSSSSSGSAEQRISLRFDGFQELLRYGMVQEMKQRIVETLDIQQPAGFVMQLKLRPSDDLAELFQRSISAGQSNEAVREIGHQRFAFVHGFDDAQIFQMLVRHFLVNQKARDHADDIAAVFQH